MSTAPESDNEFARGWKVLAASFLGIGVSLVSLVFYTAGIWIIPWQDAFGWTRAEIGFSATLTTITLVLSAPFAGQLIDRFGLRTVSTLSLIFFAAGLLLVGRMNGNLWVFYGLTVAYTLVAVASTPLAFTRAVNAWFHKNRGMALGISLTSTGVAAALLPLVLTPYVEQHGWRAGFALLSVIILVAVPIIWLWIPDGGPESTGTTPVTQQRIPEDSVRDIVSGIVFWRLAVIFFLIALAVCGLIPSFVPLLRDAGLSAETASAYLAAIGVSVIAGRLVTGFLVDRIFAPYVTAAVFAFVSIGLMVFGFGGVGFALVGAVALGFAIGAEVDLIGYYTARYFGMGRYGVLFGILYSSFSVGCALSPVIAGYIWDQTGSYDLALKGAAVLVGGAVLLTLTLPQFDQEMT
ncbi:MFS transporter [Planktotalea sp.]|uniref:MFS transporter n=1 Tax=Planktotalea sp. TaxID=2029877 RepID=UPI003297D1A6